MRSNRNQHGHLGVEESFILGRGVLLQAGLLLPLCDCLNLHISSFPGHKVTFASIIASAGAVMHHCFCVCHEDIHSIALPAATRTR